MIEALLTLLVYVVFAGVILWLITYIIDQLPMDPRFKSIARVIVLVIGVLILLVLLLQIIGGGLGTIPRLR